MIRPEIETEDLLLSITKNCETLVMQTDRKAEETLEYIFNKSAETFHFKPPIPTKRNSMIGLTSLEVYNSLFNITEQNNQFEFYKDNCDDFSFAKLKHAFEESSKIPDISLEDLQNDTGPIVISMNRKLQLKKNEH